jgi:hypothetical protein
MAQADPMRCKGFLLTSVLGALLAAVTVLAPSGPASAAAPGRIGPGTQLVTAGHACTANFVFRDARHRVYLGYAASCATRAVTAPGSCARALPAGTRVRLADRGRTVAYGVLRYSSLRALHRAGVTDAATCAANDFALVEVRAAARRRVSPSVPFWGGPSSLGALPDATGYVFGLARPSAGARTLPRAGQVTVAGPTIVSVSTPLPSITALRGSGFLDDAGRAVGILTRSTASGDNTVVSLATAVAYARAHGVPGLHLVRGRDAFTGTAVL